MIRKAQEGTGRPGRPPSARTRGAAVGRRARRCCAARSELHGARLVAEEKIGFSTRRALTPKGLAPRPFAVRCSSRDTPAGFEVMPGGLAMTVDPDQRGGA